MGRLWIINLNFLLSWLQHLKIVKICINTCISGLFEKSEAQSTINLITNMATNTAGFLRRKEFSDKANTNSLFVEEEDSSFS